MRKQAIGKEKARGGESLGPPWPSRYDELAVEASQPTVGNDKPPTRPANAAIPDTSRPDQDGRDNATHEADLLNTFDGPVYRSSNADAIFSFGKTEFVTKEGDPEGQEDEEEGVVTPSRSQFEVLCSQGRFEDQEIQIYHGGGARSVVQRITLLARARQNGVRTGGMGGGLGSGGSSLDNGVDVVGHVEAEECQSRAREGKRARERGRGRG